MDTVGQVGKFFRGDDFFLNQSKMMSNELASLVVFLRFFTRINSPINIFPCFQKQNAASCSDYYFFGCLILLELEDGVYKYAMQFSCMINPTTIDAFWRLVACKAESSNLENYF